MRVILNLHSNLRFHAGTLGAALFTLLGLGVLHAASFTQPDSQALPNVYQWTDTCNVWLLKDGDAAILIDLGDGSVLDHLSDIGVRQLDCLLFTHHHREQSQGAPKLEPWRARGTKVAAPEAERAFFEHPNQFRKMVASLEDPYTIHSSSYVRPPIEAIALDQTFKTNDVFHWRGQELLCLDTRGNSPGSMTYLLRAPSKQLAFSGDLVLADGKMHTWFDSEWDYGFGAGIRALRASASALADRAPDWLLPSHGPPVPQPVPTLRAYADHLRRFEALYLRGYGVEGASVPYQDKVSTPTVVSNVWQISPHLFKFKRLNFWPNFTLILADSGHALLSDCGLLDEAFLDTALDGMKTSFGLKAIDAIIISHMHGDHFLEAPHLREKWGAQIWALDRMVDKMEHPDWFDYAAPIQAYNKKAPDGSRLLGVHVDRSFKSGESFDWERMHFTVDWMPGQTEFALCLHGIIDGRNIAFTGDNIFGDPDDATQSGHEAMVAHNSAILEEGYIYGAEFLKRLNPDLLVGGHSFVMNHPAAFIERYRQWAYQMRDAFQSLSSDPDYRYAFDPFWVRAEPYRLSLKRGESSSVTLHVRNFRPSPQVHRIEIHTPPGLSAEPAVIEQSLSADSRNQFRFNLKAAPTLEPGVHLVGFDVTVGGQRFGERFDMVVGIEQ